MIICSCNVLTETQVLETLKLGPGPKSAVQTYRRCLGCAPQCGRCLKTVRALVANAHLGSRLENCQVGCGTCPAGHDELDHATTEGIRVEAPVLTARSLS
jgi:bacterioferritin-associated ferredoxin